MPVTHGLAPAGLTDLSVRAVDVLRALGFDLATARLADLTGCAAGVIATVLAQPLDADLLLVGAVLVALALGVLWWATEQEQREKQEEDGACAMCGWAREHGPQVVPAHFRVNRIGPRARRVIGIGA